MERDKFRELVDEEYQKQDHRYDALHCDHFWLELVTEEIGEVCLLYTSPSPRDS